jgi:hypothetical protein
MSDVTTNKITESELAEIKMLQGKFQEMIFKFGNLQIEKLELDRMVSEFVNKEKSLKDEWVNLQKLEGDLMDKIIKKYGEINLDVSNGSFTPTNIKT